RVHQHRGRICGLAAGHVQADAVERTDTLAQARAVFLDVRPRPGALVLVIAAHALGGGLQRVAVGMRERIERTAQLVARQLERPHRRRVDTVEAPRVFEHCLVAARANVGDDARDRLLDRLVLRGLVGEQRGQARGEIGGSTVEPCGQPDGHGDASPSPAASAERRAARASASSSGSSLAARVFSAAWLTMSRAEIGMISSTSTSWFARSVPPVLTRSTIASARPTSGASSIEPYSLIGSTCTPLAAKCS